MYYVNVDQINRRLAFIPQLIQACEELDSEFEKGSPKIITYFAQERVLHLAIETVTDVGSLLIDGFMMRDASSYEDIVEILGGERVFSDEIMSTLLELVKLRRPLVQEYDSYTRDGKHPLLGELPRILPVFKESVDVFIRKELI
ncbi:DUF86 domain-containing protein [Paenibacillus sp. FJAT-26967]|uniref:DUF86 domain-containing protein n=1 Tax=Paenibacillus sp. FJAT-26967 TaxID=1729690 RepID=UPI0008398C2E|nr:HepT-like ribonuclease domain-containing protein [Paenibacillus sp. FJAT-26967]